jgi:hypothetical protein
MNLSIYGVNSMVSLSERILNFGKTNELSKSEKMAITVDTIIFCGSL